MTPSFRDLAERFGMSVVALEPVSDPAKPLGRAASYRARLACGSLCKVRVMPTAEAASVGVRLHAVLRERARPPGDGRATIEIPEARGCSDRLVVTDWVEGRPLSSLAGFEAALGDLLGRIHACPLPAEERAAARLVGSSESAGSFTRHLDVLVARGLLDRDEARLARRFAVEFRPAGAGVGIVHRDLCASNVVLDADDRLWLIDNETISIRELDHDLGRTWTRAGLTENGWTSFFAGYAASRSIDSYAAHFPHWALLASAESAAFRALHWACAARPPLGRLRLLISGLARGVAPARLMVS